ncbi:ubiquitin-associated protein 2-like [Chanos chanos]|uniref:Ubiquitin-associated protein 2-like n=1 Tax=Chanos chanos TaxID=29144 RepID=A0A6J2WAK2_CHACN|nr:ubiquitin-associated protein 2-like [Chanos chanos]
MTSVVSDQGRGNKDRAQPQTTQTTQPQKQIQATAEQIRLAQVIYDKNDADFEGKVKQLIEVTGRTQDECMVALHDCNEDVNRAINFLLEGAADKSSWETVGKKKSVGKEGITAENKENREKRGEREAGRGRGGPNRRGRGASRAQEARSEENGFDSAPGERGAERGRRGRGKGSVGRGRGRGAGVNRPSQGIGTFNPAEYAGPSGPETAEAALNGTDGTGMAWQNSVEEWAAEDWTDLSESKVFTSSFALANKNHTPSAHGVDLVPLLPKAGAGEEGDLGDLEPSYPAALGQSLVFTNSQQLNGRPSAAMPTHSYAHAAANSYAQAAAGASYAHAASSSGFGSSSGGTNGSKPVQSELQRTEALNGSRLAALPGQAAAVARGNGGAAAGEPSGSAAPAPAPVTLPPEPKTESTVTPPQQLDLKAQPEPSVILSQLVQQQIPTAQTDLQAQAREPSPPVQPSLPPPRDGPSPAKPNPEAPPAEAAQHRQIRTQRRKVPPPSKIPSSAVEMPGSVDASVLNVQFGALDFGSESAMENLGQAETSTSSESSPAPPPPQSSLFSKPNTGSESVSSLPPSLPPAVTDPRYPSPSLGLPTATGPGSSAANRTETTGPRAASNIPLSQNQDSGPGPLSNGFSDVRTATTQDTPKPEPAPLPSESSLTSSASTAPPAVQSAALPSLSSTHSLGSAVSTSSSLTASAEGSVSLSASAVSASNAAVSATNNLSVTGAPGLIANATSAPSASRTAPLLTATSGKAPPNLPQGVPPLLPNQYIMGPGGLLPAYPQIYGYEDLQMMQSRLPMDYYGVTFPGTTAALAGRDGGLANNPYAAKPPNSEGTTRRPRRPRPACPPFPRPRPSSRPRRARPSRTKPRVRASRTRAKPSSALPYPLATATRACLTTLEYQGSPVPFSTARQSSCPLPPPNSTRWAWETPPTSTSTSLGTVSTPTAQALTRLVPTTEKQDTEAAPSPRPSRPAAVPGKPQACPDRPEPEGFRTSALLCTARLSLLTSRVSPLPRPLLSACRLPWGALDRLTLGEPLAMALPLSSTSYPPISSRTHRCYITISPRMDRYTSTRASQVSAASPAACRNPKATSPVTAAPPTGQTEEA